MTGLPTISARSGLGLLSIGLPFAMLIALSVAAPNFSSYENLTNINNQITALLIVSLGQLLVALVAGIDISIGSVVSLTSVILVTVDPQWALPLAVVLGLAVGLANGLGVVLTGVHPLIMTLATMTFVQGLALLFRSGSGGGVPAWIVQASTSGVFGLPAGLIWCVLSVAVTAFLIYRTRFGLRIFAIGANEQSTRLSGVKTTLPRIACYMLCSFSGVVAGVYLTERIANGDPLLGQSYGLDSITAIALGGVQLAGGTGSVLGVVLGTIALGLITNGMNLLGVSPFFRAALTGVLLVGAVCLQRRKVIGI